jgi:dsDNA-specific endonuclease/ATPase MutS2
MSTFLDWLRSLFKTSDSQASSLEAEIRTDSPDDPDVDPYNPFPELVEIEIKDVIDLHTIPPRDVSRVVEEYLRQAQEAGFAAVRIIHGKGIFVQRTLVRGVLEKTPFVIDWTDAPPEAGGLGATIVRLDRG